MLLKPRFKVIALWPNTEYQVGDILSPEYYIEKTIKWCESFPHLFKRLEWYEERKTDDLPMYLKHKEGDFFHKVERWLGLNAYGNPLYEFIDMEKLPRVITPKVMLPATESEYLQYHAQKSNIK